LSLFLTAGLALAVGLLFLVPAPALAEEGVGVAISPLTFELTANPGDTLFNKIRVYNPTTSIVFVKMEVEDFAVSGETGEVMIEPAETETYSLAKWVRPNPKEFTLEPLEQKFVEFYIDVPLNAEPGGHYGSLLASTTGVIGSGITGVATAQRVGGLILLSVAGDVNESLKVKEFSSPSFIEYGPAKFNIRFINDGSVHVRPRGFVTITDIFGRKVTDVEFSQFNVIPGAIRKIEAGWNKRLLIGRYTASLVGSYGTNNNPWEPAVVTFWAFPWKIGAVVFAAFIISLIFFIKTRRRWFMALKILITGEK